MCLFLFSAHLFKNCKTKKRQNSRNSQTRQMPWSHIRSTKPRPRAPSEHPSGFPRPRRCWGPWSWKAVDPKGRSSAPRAVQPRRGGHRGVPARAPSPSVDHSSQAGQARPGTGVGGWGGVSSKAQRSCICELLRAAGRCLSWKELDSGLRSVFAEQVGLKGTGCFQTCDVHVPSPHNRRACAAPVMCHR